MGTKGGPAGFTRVSKTRKGFREERVGVRTPNGKGRRMKPCERVLCGPFVEEIFLQRSTCISIRRSKDNREGELTSGVWKSTLTLSANLRSEAAVLKSPLRPAESPT